MLFEGQLKSFQLEDQNQNVWIFYQLAINKAGKSRWNEFFEILIEICKKCCVCQENLWLVFSCTILSSTSDISGTGRRKIGH